MAKRAKRAKTDLTLLDMLMTARDLAHEVSQECLLPALAGDRGSYGAGLLSVYSAVLLDIAVSGGTDPILMRERIAALNTMRSKLDDLLTRLDQLAQERMEEEAEKLVQE